MEPRVEVLVLGIGNVLWADEGFGVRAVEALHAAFEFPAGVAVMDGGTLGLNLYEPVATAARVLVLDAIDFALAPGTLRVLRGDEVPAWGRTKLSPHQTGFNDVLALAELNGRAPAAIVAIGVQPVDLSDFGGSLHRAASARALSRPSRSPSASSPPGAFQGARDASGEAFEPLNASPLELAAYESGRPSDADACRAGDPRLLARNVGGAERTPEPDDFLVRGAGTTAPESR